MLQLLRRLVSSRRTPVAAPAAAVEAGGSCALSACGAGVGATVLEVRCGDQEACRLRALGLCEGARVDVVDARHAVLLEVRGTRIAIGRALSAGITVQPVQDGAAATRRPFLPNAPLGAAAAAAGAAVTTTLAS